MSCGCENRKRMQDLAKVRELAKKAARMEGRVYVLYEKAGGVYGFVAEGEEYEGKLVELVWHF